MNIGVGSGSAVNFYSGGSLRWRFDSSGNFEPTGSDGGFSLATSSKRASSVFFATSLTGTQGSLNASTPVLTHTATWNNSGVTFQNILSNVTDTASANAASLIDLQVGSASKFKVEKQGIPYYGGNTATTADVTNATVTPGDITGLSAGGNLVASARYTFRFVAYFNDSVAADGARFDFDGGTATFTIARIHCNVFDTALLLSAQTTAIATDFVATTTTGDSVIQCDGTLVVNAAGTFIPRAAQEAHSTGTLTVYRGSFLQLQGAP